VREKRRTSRKRRRKVCVGNGVWEKLYVIDEALEDWLSSTRLWRIG
jgi:hypothetical protein